MRRQLVGQVLTELEVSERRACRALGQWRSTQRYASQPTDDEASLTECIIDLPANMAAMAIGG